MILVTGYKGFIGGALFSHLLKLGGSNIIGREREDSLEELDFSKIELIYHLGAITDTECSDKKILSIYNIDYTKLLISKATPFSIPIIYASTAAGLNQFGLMSDIDLNLYAVSKYQAEQFGILNYPKFFWSLRLFNVYGFNESRKGKMASVAYQAMSNGKWHLFPNKPMRDFVYIDDVISAFLISPKSPPGIYQIGTGIASTFENVLDHLKIPYTYNFKYTFPKSYQFYSCADPSAWIPGWKPKYPLELGLNSYKQILETLHEKHS